MLRDFITNSTNFFNGPKNISKIRTVSVKSGEDMKPPTIDTQLCSFSCINSPSGLTISSLPHRPGFEDDLIPTPVQELPSLSPSIAEHNSFPLPNFKFMGSSLDPVSIPDNVLFQVQNYQVLVKLGSGAFAEVYLSRSIITGKLVALKMIPTTSVLQSNFDHEVEIMRQFDHPNIVRLLDAFSTSDHHVLVQEYVPNGELLYLVTKHQKELSEEAILQLFRQCVEAIAYMHEKGFAHCDIKLENFLVDAKLLNGVPTIKLCDFGLAISCSPSSLSTYRKCGSDEYIAPELIVSSDRVYDPRSSDIWSLGIILYALLVGQLPFTYDTPQTRLKMFHRIARGEINFPASHTPGAKLLSEDLKGMVLGLLKANPRHRTPISAIFPNLDTSLP